MRVFSRRDLAQPMPRSWGTAPRHNRHGSVAGECALVVTVLSSRLEETSGHHQRCDC